MLATRYDVIVEGMDDFYLFVDYLQEHGAAAEMLFCTTVDPMFQQTQLGHEIDANVVQSIWDKHMSNNAMHPLTLVDTSHVTCSWADLTELLLHIKAALGSKYLAFLSRSMNPKLVTLHRILVDAALYAYFFAYVIQRGQHHMLQFWMSVMQLQGGSKDCVKNLFDRYVSQGMCSSTQNTIDASLDAAIDQETKLQLLLIQSDDQLQNKLWIEFIASSQFEQYRSNMEKDAAVSPLSILKAHVDNPLIQVHALRSAPPIPRTEAGRIADYVCIYERKEGQKPLLLQSYPKTAWPAYRVPSHTGTFCFPLEHAIDARMFPFVLCDNGPIYGMCRQLDTDHEGTQLAVCLLSRTAPIRSMRQALSFDSVLPPIDTIVHEALQPCTETVQADPALLARFLRPSTIISILEHLWAEHRVIATSAQLTLLTAIMDPLLQLLLPFEWPFLYVPLLPSALLTTLHCPSPLFIGIHASLLQDALALDPDLVVVHLDTDTVSTSPITLPPRTRARLHHAVALFCYGHAIALDSLSSNTDTSACSCSSCGIHSRWIVVRQCIEDMWNKLLFDRLHEYACHVGGNLVLDVPRMLAASPPDHQAFLRSVCSTAAFQGYVSHKRIS